MERRVVAVVVEFVPFRDVLAHAVARQASLMSSTSNAKGKENAQTGCGARAAVTHEIEEERRTKVTEHFDDAAPPTG